MREFRITKAKNAPSGPLGDPAMANSTYMTIFVVLERMAFMRLTDDELERWATRTLFSSVGYYARAEQERRRRLEGIVNLRGANLCGANLRGASLYGANLRGADLYAANLRDANLYGVVRRDTDPSIDGWRLDGNALRKISS